MGGTVPRTGTGDLVGRDAELATLHRLLGPGRLVTLTGTAGVGKTRLALAYVHGQAHAYPGGVWFEDLADDNDDLTGFVPGDEPALLVLDTCEHRVEKCAMIVHTLMREHPALAVLATSREPLGVPGELVCRLGPLTVPQAAALFAQRMAAQGHPPAPGTEEAIERICRRLDGLPLAVDLAATRAVMLSPGQIAERLNDPLRLLSGGSRVAHARHRSLRAALCWSHALLSDDELLLLRRLTAFEDGFVIDDVEWVCSDGAITTDRIIDLLARLVAKSLVEVDTTGAVTRYRLLWIVRVHAMQGMPAEEAEAVRLRHAEYYARLAERAAEAIVNGAAAPHLDRIEAGYANIRAALRWCVSGGPLPIGARLAGGLETYWIMRGRLREGLDWLAALADASGAAADPLPGRVLAELTLSTAVLSTAAGEFATATAAGRRALTLFEDAGDEAGRRRAATVLAALRAMTEPASASRALAEITRPSAPGGRDPDRDGQAWAGVPLALLGCALLAAGDLAGARAASQRCVSIGRRHDSERSLEAGLLASARVAACQGAYDEAERALDQGLALARTIGDGWGVAEAMRGLGELAACRGRYGEAREWLDDAVKAARAAGSPQLLGECLDTLGRLLLDIGEHDNAGHVFSEVVELGERTTARYAAMGLAGSGAAILGSRGGPAATTFAEEAVARAREAADRPLMWWCLFTLGRVIRESDPGRAASTHHLALKIAADLGLRGRIADSLEAVAGLQAAQRGYERAARLLGAAHSLRDRLGLCRPPALASQYESDLETVRAALGAEGFGAAWTEGARLDEDRAVAYAGRGRESHGRGVGWAALTRAERQVALLASQGLTNREVGERLFVSPRTVQAHLSSVFAKLGIASRRDLAREVAARNRSLSLRESDAAAWHDHSGGAQDAEGGVAFGDGQLRP